VSLYCIDEWCLQIGAICFERVAASNLIYVLKITDAFSTRRETVIVTTVVIAEIGIIVTGMFLLSGDLLLIIVEVSLFDRILLQIRNAGLQHTVHLALLFSLTIISYQEDEMIATTAHHHQASSDKEALLLQVTEDFPVTFQTQAIVVGGEPPVVMMVLQESPSSYAM
jgi:hypothetical protein